jgi:hypothetical protein
VLPPAPFSPTRLGAGILITRSWWNELSVIGSARNALTTPDEMDSHRSDRAARNVAPRVRRSAHRFLSGRSGMKQWIAICALSMSSALLMSQSVANAPGRDLGGVVSTLGCLGNQKRGLDRTHFAHRSFIGDERGIGRMRPAPN